MFRLLPLILILAHGNKLSISITMTKAEDTILILNS